MRRNPEAPAILVGGSIAGATFDGGVPTAVLGLAIHFFIAFSITTVYWAASTRLPVLNRQTSCAGHCMALRSTS